VGEEQGAKQHFRVPGRSRQNAREKGVRDAQRLAVPDQVQQLRVTNFFDPKRLKVKHANSMWG